MSEQRFLETFEYEFILYVDDLIKTISDSILINVTDYIKALKEIWTTTILDFCEDYGYNANQNLLKESPISFEETTLELRMKMATIDIYEQQLTRLYNSIF